MCSSYSSTAGLELNCVQTNLVSGLTGAACHYTSEMVLPFGIALRTHHCRVKEIAVADYGAGVVFQLDPCGNAASSTIITLNAAHTGPGSPIGVVYNPCCKGFPIAGTGATGPSCLIIADYDGFLRGFNPDVNTLYAINVPSTGVNGGNFTSIALHKDYLYVTNPTNNAVYVYNDNWDMVLSFSDSSLASLVVPYGVGVVEYKGRKRLAVTFAALFGSLPPDQGTGLGYVDLFDFDWTPTTPPTPHRFVSQSQLNAPGPVFSVRVAGENYIGVGNNGNGLINLFDEEGEFVTRVGNRHGKDLVVPNVLGIRPDPEKAVLYVTTWAATNNPGSGIFALLTVV